MRIILLILFIASTSACSSIQIEKGKKDNALIFYAPQPYILVTDRFNAAGAKQGQQITVLYLPDCSEPRSIRTKARLGSVTFNPTLSDGWNLTGFSSTVDNQVDETISSIGSLASTILGLSGEDDEVKSGLYKILYNNTGVSGFEYQEISSDNSEGTSCASIVP